nr:MAG TPA: hypothetical protein [Caudoviricetes sp.]
MTDKYVQLVAVSLTNTSNRKSDLRLRAATVSAFFGQKVLLVLESAN